MKPPPPEIVIVKTEDCGRTIQVEWKSPYSGHDLQLDMANGRREQAIYDKTSFSPHTQHFRGLKSNMIYEVRIRVNNSYGISSWAKKQTRTTAGIVMLIDS